MSLAALLALSAVTLARPLQDGSPEFRDLFDGKTIQGWKCNDMSYWTVEEGAIAGRITGEHPLKVNLYLVYQGGDLADFELKLRSRVTGSKGTNNGFQFRSKLLHNFDVAGYQVDNNLDTDWRVRLYDEHGRHTLAMRGVRTFFDGQGKARSQKIPEAQGPAHFHLEDWHEYHLVCRGPRLTLRVDGKLVAEVIDDDPRNQDLSGILALQLHSGPPALAEFKDIRLRVLKPGDAPSLPPPAFPPAPPPGVVLGDKTLVAWASPANLAQRGGSVLTLDDSETHFDGIVFGELAARRWMPGSDFHRRTPRRQEEWPEETAAPGTFVQMALVTKGREVTLYRDGRVYARHQTDALPQEFGPESVVVIGKRHLEQKDEACFAGAIDEVRIYDRALTADEIAALRPDRPSEIAPWAWWTFDTPEAKERTGRFGAARLSGGAAVENGKLVLDGKGGAMIASPAGK